MLNAKNFGLAGGLLWAVYFFVFTYINMFSGYGSMWVALLADVYPYYEVTLVGSLIGTFWAFLDGFVGLYLFAWLYNKING